MERSVYFDGWFPNDHCYHPSLPPRRLAMLEDLEEMGATMLVWAGLGGGSISLPYLEEEAFGEIPARFRHWGFVNEGEFIAHAKDRAIDLFAIVFEAQAWEFPAELEAGAVLAQNQLRGAAEVTTLGLREFSQDTGPASWKPFRHYFPEGLRNSDGDDVVDLWEEVASRDLEGNPLHAHWVEVSGKGQNCYFADRNNPVWREYLKAVIRIQIDAGAPGIQLDETDSPMTAFRYGGCYCKDCVKEMRLYLLGLPAAELPDDLDGIDLETFDYRLWLLGLGFRAGANPQSFPLYAQYARSQQLAIVRTFTEMVDYARGYARSVGKSIRIAGNFYDCAPYYDPMVDLVDVLVTEMRETRYQQPWYFRHGVGLARGKSLVAVENPYGGVVPALHDKLRRGRARDLFRLTIFEATAMGANMALPYGSWLGTEIRDSYWAPRDLAVECGRFLTQIDSLISAESPHRTAVVYSVRSMMRTTLDSDQFSDAGRWFAPVETKDYPTASYWEAVEALSRSSATYDVVVFPDDQLRADDVSLESLSRYETIVLPTAWAISEAQHRAIVDFASAGGRVVVQGEYGSSLPDDALDELLGMPGVVCVESVAELPAETRGEVSSTLGPLAAVSLQIAPAGGISVHVLNYDYDDDADAVVPRDDVALSVRLPGTAFDVAELYEPGVEGGVGIPLVTRNDGEYEFVISRLTCYAVVHLSQEGSKK